MAGKWRERKRESLTPYLDELRRRKQLLPDGEPEAPMPRPSQMDRFFAESAAKHGIDLVLDDEEP